MNAQTALSPVVQPLDELYTSLQFEATIQEGKRILENQAQLSARELVLVHQYIGLSYYSLGKLDSARSHFYSLLSIDPNWKMDPVKISPKIIAFFEQLKAERAAPPSTLKIVPYTHYVFVPDIRLKAGWRSALLPGWGQLLKKQKKKALVIGAVFYPSLLAAVVSAFQERKAHRSYLHSQTLADIQSTYKTYNTWHRRRLFFVQVTAATWILAVVDALWMPYPSLNVQANSTSFAIRYSLRF